MMKQQCQVLILEPSSGFGKAAAPLLVWLCKPRLSCHTPPLPPSLLSPGLARTQLLFLCQLLTSVLLMPPPPCSWWTAVLPDGDSHLRSLDLNDFAFPLSMPMKLSVVSSLPQGYCWNKCVAQWKEPRPLLTGFKTFCLLGKTLFNEPQNPRLPGNESWPWAGKHKATPWVERPRVRSTEAQPGHTPAAPAGKRQRREEGALSSSNLPKAYGNTSSSYLSVLWNFFCIFFVPGS